MPSRKRNQGQARKAKKPGEHDIIVASEGRMICTIPRDINKIICITKKNSQTSPLCRHCSPPVDASQHILARFFEAFHVEWSDSLLGRNGFLRGATIAMMKVR